MAYGMTFLVQFFFAKSHTISSGMLWKDLEGDPRLGAKRNQLAMNAVRRLAGARMVDWNKPAGILQSTDLGRIAAKYYIRLSSIEIFSEKFKPRMSEADVLTMLSYSTEVSSSHSSPFCVFSLCSASSSTRSNCASLRQRSWRPFKRRFPVM